MQVDCGSWIRWLGSEAALTRYEAAGKDMKYNKRSNKRYDDDGHWEDVALRLVLLFLYHDDESASPT